MPVMLPLLRAFVLAVTGSQSYWAVFTTDCKLWACVLPSLASATIPDTIYEHLYRQTCLQTH